MVVMTSFPPPTEGLHHIQENTEAFVQDKSYGVGTLYIATDRLSWCDSSGQGFSLEYPAISLHAVCRDTSQFPQECLYCMTEMPLDDNETDRASDDSDDRVGEIRFVPQDKAMLDVMFRALSDCQILHPDPQEEEEEDEDFFCDADEGDLSEQGQATLDHLESVIHMPSQQDFVQMTSLTNGEGLNGHHRDEQELYEENEEQFEDADN
ncbi:methylosome subunit pICln-like isoform X2 [Montipora foliosa]|uniref:methylosome subunit pICln-like isoform X2 n=1 Tax=Montipora foliosa TaxID=591990 RepID=UPI0035F1B41B